MSELDYMDALAAEYVLGTLDVEERTQARTLLEADEAFAAKVQLWERRFGDLHLMVEPVEPDSAIWARIRAKMLEVRQQRLNRQALQWLNRRASTRSKRR
jgi:anti-sigma-K factor RskA